MANLAQSLERGYKIGRTIPGRFSGFGTAIKTIANGLRAEREVGLEVEGKKAILGETERLRPKTQPIVSRTGEVVGTRPAGAVFQTKERELSSKERELVGGIRQLKAEGRDDEVMDFINFSGFDPADYVEEIGELKAKAPKKSFMKKIQEVFSQ